MQSVFVQQVHRSRLIQELKVLGMDIRGSRSELVSRLVQAGVYKLDPDASPLPEFVDRVTRFPNHSSVLIGNCAQADTNIDNQLVIGNNAHEPLIRGDFAKGVVTLQKCLSLGNSENIGDIEGMEGEIRRVDENLYMYRSTVVCPGWYPIQFGTVVIF